MILTNFEKYVIYLYYGLTIKLKEISDITGINVAYVNQAILHGKKYIQENMSFNDFIVS